MGENKMFKLNLQRIEEKYLKVNKKDEAWMWYMIQTFWVQWSQRFGQEAVSARISNLEFKNKFCEGCMVGK
jgi:hypothetical protein